MASIGASTSASVEAGRSEREPLLLPPSLEAIEAQDAAYANRLNEEEMIAARRAEIEANARAWDAHYRFEFLRYFQVLSATFSGSMVHSDGIC